MLPFCIGSRLLLQNHLLIIVRNLTILGHDFPLFFDFKGGIGITSILEGGFYVDNRVVVQFSIFLIVAFISFSLLKMYFFNFYYLEESEAISVIFMILPILGSKSILLTGYFFLSLSIIIFRHRKKLLKYLLNQKMWGVD